MSEEGARAICDLSACPTTCWNECPTATGHFLTAGGLLPLSRPYQNYSHLFRHIIPVILFYS